MIGWKPLDPAGGPWSWLEALEARPEPLRLDWQPLTPGWQPLRPCWLKAPEDWPLSPGEWPLRPDLEGGTDLRTDGTKSPYSILLDITPFVSTKGS